MVSSLTHSCDIETELVQAWKTAPQKCNCARKFHYPKISNNNAVLGIFSKSVVNDIFRSLLRLRVYRESGETRLVAGREQRAEEWGLRAGRPRPRAKRRGRLDGSGRWTRSSLSSSGFRLATERRTWFLLRWTLSLVSSQEPAGVD